MKHPPPRFRRFSPALDCPLVLFRECERSQCNTTGVVVTQKTIESKSLVTRKIGTLLSETSDVLSLLVPAPLPLKSPAKPSLLKEEGKNSTRPTSPRVSAFPPRRWGDETGAASAFPPFRHGKEAPLTFGQLPATEVELAALAGRSDQSLRHPRSARLAISRAPPEAGQRISRSSSRRARHPIAQFLRFCCPARGFLLHFGLALPNRVGGAGLSEPPTANGSAGVVVEWGIFCCT